MSLNVTILVIKSTHQSQTLRSHCDKINDCLTVMEFHIFRHLQMNTTIYFSTNQ